MHTFIKVLVAVSLFAPSFASARSVATATIWATEAGQEMLKAGGTAADAAVAASFMLNVTLSNNMGVGGGGFFLAEKNGKLTFWNSRELAPASAHPKMFLKPDGKPIPAYPERMTGPNPVGIPGTALGLWEAHKALGKLPWKKLLQPAIKLAREGFPITDKFEFALEEEWPRLKNNAAAVSLYGDGQGGHLRAGQIFRNPQLAKTLERIAEKGAPEFYTGDLARGWLGEAQKLGVKITPEDLKNYKVQKLEPVRFKTFGLTAYTAPPPSAAGVTVAGTLSYLDHYYKSHDTPAADSAERIVVTTEALRYFQELRDKTIGDAPDGKLDPHKFPGSADETAAWTEIDKRVTARLDRIQTRVGAKNVPMGTIAYENRFLPKHRGHTTHLSAIDDHGMAVSYTTTIEEWFGSALAVPGYGFLLNNELSDFSAEPGEPNSPAPGKHPRSNMSPTLLFAGNTLVGAVGCAGGGRIPTAVVEMVENYWLHKMTGRQALSFTRFHPGADGKLEIEKSVSTRTLERLKEAGYNVEVTAAHSTGQGIFRRDGKSEWEAAADPRGDGEGLTL